MSRTMPRDIGNEVQASTAKFLFEELFELAHDHTVRASLPTAQDGNIGDIVIVDTGSAVSICIKTSRGWFQTAALTAI